MSGEKEILHRAGRSAQFIKAGNFAAGLEMGGNGDHDLCLFKIFAELGALFRSHFSQRGDLIIEDLECLGQAGARPARENMKTPRLGQTVGRRPVSVFEDFHEKLVSYFAAAVHSNGFDGTPGAVGKIIGHGD